MLIPSHYANISSHRRSRGHAFNEILASQHRRYRNRRWNNAYVFHQLISHALLSSNKLIKSVGIVGESDRFHFFSFLSRRILIPDFESVLPLRTLRNILSILNREKTPPNVDLLKFLNDLFFSSSTYNIISRVYIISFLCRIPSNYHIQIPYSKSHWTAPLSIPTFILWILSRSFSIFFSFQRTKIYTHAKLLK